MERFGLILAGSPTTTSLLVHLLRRSCPERGLGTTRLMMTAIMGDLLLRPRDTAGCQSHPTIATAPDRTRNQALQCARRHLFLDRESALLICSTAALFTTCIFRIFR